MVMTAKDLHGLFAPVLDRAFDKIMSETESERDLRVAKAKDQYTCAACGETHDKQWSDEEAMAEAHANFGDTIDQEACDIVCDDCYKQMMKECPPLSAKEREESEKLNGLSP